MAERKKPVRTALHDQDVITRELISAIMTEGVLGSLNKPSGDAMDRLAQILETWRKYYIGSQKFDPLRRETYASASALEASLLKLRSEYYSGILEFPEIETKVKAIDMALRSINYLYKESIAVEGASEITWMWLANAIPADFIGAVGSTNPGRRVGIGQGGPLSRFVAAVVPYVTGEHPTAESVATQLKSHRKRSRDR